MKETIKAALTLAAMLLTWAPCLCAFSEGDNMLVNAFGLVYTVVIVKICNSSPEKRKAVKTWLKSIVTLNPDINKI